MDWIYHGDSKPSWANEGQEVLYAVTMDDLLDMYSQLWVNGENIPSWKDMYEVKKRAVVTYAKNFLGRYMESASFGWRDAFDLEMLREP